MRKMQKIIVQKQITESTKEARNILERGRGGGGLRREKKLSGLLDTGNRKQFKLV